MSDKNEGGVLSWVFNVAVVAVAVNIAWQVILDPLFFPVFHPTVGHNEMGQALVMFMKDWFGWIPYHLGLTGEGGLMQPAMEWMLSDQLNVVKTAGGTGAFDKAFGGLSLDSLTPK